MTKEFVVGDIIKVKNKYIEASGVPFVFGENSAKGTIIEVTNTHIRISFPSLGVMLLTIEEAENHFKSN